MRLVLARHGNTFGPGDTPVWVGAREDLPLTDTGEAQSRRIGEALRDAAIVPARIVSGPLKRTFHGAQIAANACGFDGTIEIDERLKEIDYGLWGGKSDAEIAAQWGEAAIHDWRERSIVPDGASWTPPPEILAANARAVCASLVSQASKDDTVLVISSNGILRYFHAVVGGQPDRPEDSKMKTGHFAVAFHNGRRFALTCWNCAPGATFLERQGR